MINLSLTDAEQRIVRRAADTMIERGIGESSDPRHKRYNQWRSPEDRKRIMVLSCGAELAVARFLNLSWTGVNGYKDLADVGSNIEVRWTTSSYLILREYDRAGDVAFMVTGNTLQDLRLIGYYPVTKGRVDQYKLKDEEVWFIPISDLYTHIPKKGAVQAFLDYWKAQG